jgi:hypothetical protein
MCSWGNRQGTELHKKEKNSVDHRVKSLCQVCKELVSIKPADVPNSIGEVSVTDNAYTRECLKFVPTRKIRYFGLPPMQCFCTCWIRIRNYLYVSGFKSFHQQGSQLKINMISAVL